ncbi:MAG TPA: hypothetical protein VKA34_22915 [Balneolales bacterium]|nr:hypothetical protein [Balneolales bacterium]
MFIHSPVKSDKKVKPNVRRKNKPGRHQKRNANFKKGPDLVFSPNKKNSIPQYGVKNGKKKSSEQHLKWSKIQPWKIIVGSIIIGLSGLLYLNHVFETQRLLKEVNHLKQNYTKTKRIYEDRKFTYDRMIGPAEIYSKAKKLGLINGGPADKVIIIKDK